MSDYVAFIGILALIFAPLYIPIAVTIIGGVRSRREAVATGSVVDPLRVLRSAHVDRASASTGSTVAVQARGSQGVLPHSAQPVVEPV